MKVNIYSQQGKKIDEIVLPKEIFDIKVNSDLIHQTLVSQMANRRRVIAHTKDRSEVRGGGRKPWRQKGTGRARHGSIRSPLWIGGGVTFGPRKDRSYTQKVNKKMKRKALYMGLTDKVKENCLGIVDKLELPEIKTKKLANILHKLPMKESISTLIV